MLPVIDLPTSRTCASYNQFVSNTHGQQQQKTWNEQRQGFKHELALTLRDSKEFGLREAERIIDAILEAIKAALLEGEEVSIEDFGSWWVEQVPPEQRRQWRCGRPMKLKRRKIRFKLEDHVLLYALDPNWKPHTAWQENGGRPTKLRGKKLAEFQRRQQEENRQALLLNYIRAIVRFFVDEMYGEDWNLFWTVHWNSPWYVSEVKETLPEPGALRPIEDVPSLIQITRPAILDQKRENRVIDLIRWYARWTAHLDIDSALWSSAERQARDHLKHSGEWGRIYAGTKAKD